MSKLNHICHEITKKHICKGVVLKAVQDIGTYLGDKVVKDRLYTVFGWDCGWLEVCDYKTGEKISDGFQNKMFRTATVKDFS